MAGSSAGSLETTEEPGDGWVTLQGGGLPPGAHLNDQKFFGSFFQERTSFLKKRSKKLFPFRPGI
jgi:hypothetical protein